jgi:hypothetical protein
LRRAGKKRSGREREREREREILERNIAEERQKRREDIRRR